jgi:type II secretory pathway component PulF
MAELVYRRRGTASEYSKVLYAVSNAVRDTFRTWHQRVPAKQLVLVTSQLSLMLGTGNTISESLTTLGKQTEGTKMGVALNKVASSVAGGRTLAAALSEHPAVFPRLFVSAVRSGEASGRLAQVFKQLEIHMAKRAQLRENIRSALTYPTILSVLLLGVVIFEVTFVLPRFTAIFEGAGVVLPIPTRVLMGLARGARHYWYLIPVALVSGTVGIVVFLRTATGKTLADQLALRIPVLDTLVKSISISSLTRTLGMLLESGVPLIESIEVAKDSVGSYSFGQFMGEVERSVLQGNGFAAPWWDSELVTPVDQQMAETAERTGSLHTVMTRLADHHDEQVDVKLKRLTAIVEPAFIAIMGIFVGFVAMAVLLPLFKMASAVRMGG